MTSVLGLDLGGTNIKLARVEAGVQGDPDIVVTAVHPTPDRRSPEAVVARLAELTTEAPDALGLGIPGQFDSANGVVRDLPNLPGPWSGFPLRAALESQTGLPVSVVNDAQGFTLAESRLGAGRDAHSVVGMALGTGIGGGIVIGDSILTGAHGTAGEIGHQIIAADGRDACSCGNRGCLESLAKAAVMAQLAGRDSAEDVFAAAASGDERAVAAIAKVADYSGIGIANVLTIVDPEVVVIGGGIANAGDALLEPIRAAVALRSRIVPGKTTVIERGTLGTTAGAVGAALVALDALREGSGE